jgi:hypothetical protein
MHLPFQERGHIAKSPASRSFSCDIHHKMLLYLDGAARPYSSTQALSNSRTPQSTHQPIMRATTFLPAAFLALAHTITALSPIVELYPDSEDCTGRKIVLNKTGCQNVLIRGSGKVIQGGVSGFYGDDCSSQMVGVMLASHGCWQSYPGWKSFWPVNRD